MILMGIPSLVLAFSHLHCILKNLDLAAGKPLQTELDLSRRPCTSKEVASIFEGCKMSNRVGPGPIQLAFYLAKSTIC